jgi:hypothetical protein
MPAQSGPDAALSRIEETQAGLRESIDEAKRLSDRSQEILDRHRKQSGEGAEARRPVA